MSIHSSLVEEIRAASRTMVREWGFLGTTLGGTGYSASAVHTLVEIEARGKITAGQLVQTLNLEKSSVSRMISRLLKEGLLEEMSGGGDGRVKQLFLTDKGRSVVSEINAYADNQVVAAMEKLDSAQQQAVAQGLAAYAQALNSCRVGVAGSQLQAVSVKGHSQKGVIKIVPFEAQYQQDFKQLNEEWITKWFKMEEADYKALDHPQEYILNKGGFISMALLDDEPIGTCALIKMNEETYEMAKMAVSERAKGRGIGFLLGQAIVNQAKKAKAKRVYLESNTLLEPAINLYRKLGFEEVHGFDSPYERCNIQMELVL